MNIVHLVNGETSVGAITSIKKLVNELSKNTKLDIKLICYNATEIDGVNSNIEIIYTKLRFSKMLNLYSNKEITLLYFIIACPFYLLLDLCNLQYIIIKNNITIVHSHYLVDNFICSLLLKVKKVSHIRSIPNVDFFYGHGFKLFKFFIKTFSNAIIGISHAVLSDFSPLHSDFHVVYNGFSLKSKDLSVLDSNQRKELDLLDSLTDEGNFIVGAISRFNANKGLELFVNIASKVKLNDVKFIIVAPRSTKAENEYYDHLNLNSHPNIFYIGSFPNSCFVFEKFNLLIQPTLGREGFGNVILEAQNYGVPVLSTNSGGPSEIIDNENGFIFDKSDVDNFVNTILELKLDKEKYARLSKNSMINSQASRFKFESTINLITNIYRNL